MRLCETSIEFKNVKKSNDGYFSYVYFIKNGQGEEIGSCSLRVFDSENEKFQTIGNVSYEIDQEHRGQGHAKNAVKMLSLEAQTLGFSSLLICCCKNNLPSISVCRSIGAEKIREFEKDGKTVLAFLKKLECIEK